MILIKHLYSATYLYSYNHIHGRFTLKCKGHELKKKKEEKKRKIQVTR